MNWLKKLFESKNNSTSSGMLYISFHDIPVGTLEKTDDLYIFRYNPECPKEYKISSLEKDEMRFKCMPAFFATRIPSRNRPDLAEDFKRTGDDPLKILGEIGAKSPFSPYVFKLVEKV